MLLTAPKYQRGSALLTAIVVLAVLAAIVALFAPVLLTTAKLTSARDDSARARATAQGWFEYATALIYADTFGRDRIAYNGDDGDEGFDWLGDEFGPYTLAQLRDGVEVFDGHDGEYSATVRLRVIDHESLANINVHGNIYGPGGTTNVGHGVSPGEIALERALAAADLPESIFPDEDEAREAAYKLARQIVASSRFYALPGYFPGGECDRLDNHARLKYLGGADANRTGFADPAEFTKGDNDFADNTLADAAFPSFFATGPSQQRFGLDTELALQYARFYPDDPATVAGRVEDFARDEKAGRLIEKNRLFLLCLRAVGESDDDDDDDDDEILKARALFAAVAERVCTLSCDSAPFGDWRVNARTNAEMLYLTMVRYCTSLNDHEMRQVTANYKAYTADADAPRTERSFGNFEGLTRFPQISEVLFMASTKILYIDLANPFATALAEDDEDKAAIDLSNFEIRLKVIEDEQAKVYVARLGGGISRSTSDCAHAHVTFRVGGTAGRGTALEFDVAPNIASADKIESLELYYAADADTIFAGKPIDCVPPVVLAACTNTSRERIDLLGAPSDVDNWAASRASRRQTLTAPNSVALPDSDAVCAPYLEIGGDGNRFANVGEFFRLLAIGPSYDPRTGEPFESMLEFVEYLAAHRESAKLFQRLSMEDKAALYDALTTSAPLPFGLVNDEDWDVREGRINVNTALRGTLLALPYVGEDATVDTVDVDDIVETFQGDAPAEKRSEVARYSPFNAWGGPLVPRCRFPLEFSPPLSKPRVEHPEERELVPALMQQYLTTRSSVFTVLVEVELRDAAGRVVARERLVGIVDRSRPANPWTPFWSPRLRVILRHFLDWD